MHARLTCASVLCIRAYICIYMTMITSTTSTPPQIRDVSHGNGRELEHIEEREEVEDILIFVLKTSTDMYGISDERSLEQMHRLGDYFVSRYRLEEAESLLRPLFSLRSDMDVAQGGDQKRDNANEIKLLGTVSKFNSTKELGSKQLSSKNMNTSHLDEPQSESKEYTAGSNDNMLVDGTHVFTEDEDFVKNRNTILHMRDTKATTMIPEDESVASSSDMAYGFSTFNLALSIHDSVSTLSAGLSLAILLRQKAAWRHMTQHNACMQEAEDLFERVIDGRTRVLGDKHEQVGEAMSEYGDTLLEQRRFREAERFYRPALKIYVDIYTENNINSARLAYNTGVCYAFIRKFKKATVMFAQAITAYTHVFGVNSKPQQTEMIQDAQLMHEYVRKRSSAYAQTIRDQWKVKPDYIVDDDRDLKQTLVDQDDVIQMQMQIQMKMKYNDKKY